MNRNDIPEIDDNLKSNLVLKYMYIVKDVANRLYIGLPSGLIDKEDLISEGTIALLTCLDNYDESRKDSIASYIRVRAIGAMKDFLRRQDILPQKKRIEVKKIEKATFDLEMKLGRKPNKKEIIHNLNISEKKYSEIIQYMNMSNYIYIDSYEQSPLEKLEFSEDTSNPFENIVESLVGLLNSDILTYNQKMILQLYYYEELNFKQISNILNLSNARICQLHTQAIDIIRKNLYSFKQNDNSNEILL